MGYTMVQKEGTAEGSMFAEITKEELAMIYRYTKRDLEPQEIFTFPLVLCDNEIDRDNECFTNGALDTLKTLFEGVTGVFDHDPKGGNQTARIYTTWIETDEEKRTRHGEIYRCLKAKAYMVRSVKNKDLILEIEGGIKKEVSVSCSVKKAVCSICGKNVKSAGCEHVKGKTYGGRLCYVALDEPTDAYEWSFVAVPAQKKAGVVKKEADISRFVPNSVGLLLKQYDRQSEVVLSKGVMQELISFIKSLEEMAEVGRKYEDNLRQDVLRLSYLAGENLNTDVMKDVVSKLSFDELSMFKKAFAAKAGAGTKVCQLSKEKQDESRDNDLSFII